MVKILLSKEEILAKDDITTENVDIPEWGGLVTITSMTAGMRDRYEMFIYNRGDGEDAPSIRAKLVSICAIEQASGKPLFTDADIAALTAKSAAPMDRLFQAIRRLNRLGAEYRDETLGNSNGQEGNSSSA